MRTLLSLGILTALLPAYGWGQRVEPAQSAQQIAKAENSPQASEVQTESSQPEQSAADASASPPLHARRSPAPISLPNAKSKFSYYMNETFWNPSVLTAPGFRASIRMASPPGQGSTRYPSEWRQGAAGFGRNFGDAFATRISTHTAQFIAGSVTGEDPRYLPSGSRHFFQRSSHALVFTFIDRSDSGRRLPALSNLAGAAAGGFVGNAYLPDGFRDITHAGQRATFQFSMLAAGNLFREFAPQMPASLRALISLIAR